MAFNAHARPGSQRAAGLREVAQRAGVSAATVSNTLNRPHLVAAETQVRVRTAIEELGFVPHLGASSLKKGRNRLIGLVIPDVTNSFYNEIARGVLEAADLVRYSVVLCNSQDDPRREQEQLQVLAEQRAVGALVVPRSADQERLYRLRELGARLVMIDRAVPEDEGCSVAIDDVHGGRIAMQHLLDTRGSDVMLVNGAVSIRQCADRRAGAQQALRGYGAVVESLVEHAVSDMTVEAGEEVGRAIAASPPPAGIFCTNDQLAIGVIRGLTRAGVAVPGTTSVVGYGNLGIATVGHVPLTSVDQPKYELGLVAVQLLLSEIDLPVRHQHSATVFQPTMIIRESAP